MQYHPLTFVAFLLAVFLLIFPVQADYVRASLRSGNVVGAFLIIVVTIAIVAAPLLVAQLNARKQPDKWKPRLMTRLTWAIIALNVAMNIFILATFKRS